MAKSKQPVNTKYQMYLMKQQGKKIDPDNLPDDNNPEGAPIQLSSARKHLKLPKKVITNPKSMPTLPSELKKLGIELLQWVMENKPRKVRAWFHKQGYTYFEAKMAIKHDDYFRKCFILAAEICADKLEDDWLDFKVNSEPARNLLWEMDQAYKANEIERESIKNKVQEDDKDYTFIVDTVVKEEK